MELRLDLQHKRFDTAPIARLFTQGENNVDVITLRGAKMYGAIDASQLTFILRAVSEKDTLVEQQLTAATDGDDLVLTWTVTEDFTAVSGLLHLKLRGIDTAGNVVLKLGAEPIYIQADIQGDYAPPQDVLTKALNDMRGQVAAAEEQAGIAKTEADRLVQVGANFKVLGFYLTLDALQTAVPNPERGDAYGVGDNPVHAYVWSGTEWQPGQELGIDLTAYYTKTAVNEKLADKANGDAEGNALNALQLGGHSPAWYIQSNLNLLINPNFYINQRGLITYTVNESSTYTIDHWALGANGSLQVNKDKIVLTSQDNKWWYFTQKIEQSDVLRGKILTLSAFCMCPIGGNANLYLYDYGKAANICATHIPSDGAWHLITVSGIPSKEYSGNIEFALNGASNLEVEYCKLELGEHATPFVPRTVGEELALCQRNYIPGSDNGAWGIGHYIYGSGLTIKIPTPTTMRIAPRVIQNSPVRIYVNEAWVDYVGTPYVLYHPTYIIIRYSPITTMPLVYGQTYLITNVPSLDAEL